MAAHCGFLKITNKVSSENIRKATPTPSSAVVWWMLSVQVFALRLQWFLVGGSRCPLRGQIKAPRGLPRFFNFPLQVRGLKEKRH